MTTQAAPTAELAAGIYQIQPGFVNAYVVEVGSELILRRGPARHRSRRDSRGESRRPRGVTFDEIAARRGGRYALIPLHAAARALRRQNAPAVENDHAGRMGRLLRR
jgi:hypothetical protein